MPPMTFLSRPLRAAALALSLTLALPLALTPIAARAGTPPWPDAAFTYYAKGQKLDAVLREFAANFSLAVDIEPGLADIVDGRFNTRNPTEFINRLGGVFGFQWFTHAGTLYVSRNDKMATRAFSIAGSSAAVRQALTDLDVIDARFGWGDLPEQNVVLVSGPPAYLRLIETTLAALPMAPGGQQVAVFRLRHAPVEDRLIQYRDREITSPGVATVLRNLMMSNAGGNRGVDAFGANSQSLTSVAGQREPVVIGEPTPAAQPAANAGAPRPSAAARSGVRVREPSIQADPRINAIIVHDIPERIPLYEKLIAQLDVPTSLIEIEAMIIDVNKTRLEELGVAWGAVGRDGGTAIGFGNVSNTATTANTISLITAPRGTGVNPTTVIADAGNYFVSRIRALESTGDARIQSSPSILTTDNAGALIDLSETFYVRVTGERVASLTPITAGTTLRVTPRLIAQDGQPRIWMVVDIEDGRIQDRTVDELPTVRRSVVSTQAIVHADESLLIGGYNTDQTIAGNDKVPLLGDIPGVGVLFSSKTEDVQTRERLFLIRPKVVTRVEPKG